MCEVKYGDLYIYIYIYMGHHTSRATGRDPLSCVDDHYGMGCIMSLDFL